MSTRSMIARLVAVLVILTGLASPAAAQEDADHLPIPQRERPFLLVDAPRRYLPTEPARLRVQLRDGGHVSVGIFRVLDPDAALRLTGERQGISVAQGALGAEAETLWARTDAMPRRGRLLELVRGERVSMPKPIHARRVGAEDENVVYDSNDADDSVATYWVRDEGWAVHTLDLGRLPAGVYLVRVHAGSWATAALLSVGDLVLLARRGDVHDTALVTDPDGRPLTGIEVSVRDADGRARTVRTGEDGTVTVRASDSQVVRFVAKRGDDVAWSDVAHARLDPCDPRVYVATGRPLYREGEKVFVRGHVRGCDRQGRFVPLSDVAVSLEPGEGGPVTARSDADGNFTAELVAAGTVITAEALGHRHERTIRIDDRELPRRAVNVEVDRPWVVAGDLIHVSVADDDGGWPQEREVVLQTPNGRLIGRIGPGRPAVFDVPGVSDGVQLTRFPLSVSVLDGGTVTMAAAEVWVSPHATLLALSTPVTRGTPGAEVDVTVRSTDPGGAPAPGEVALAVHGSDGNRALGAPRVRRTVTVGPDGQARVRLRLAGEGPWMIVGAAGDALGQLVIWERERPPELSDRGPLSVMPATDRVDPGQTLEVNVRVPGEGTGAPGAVWVTLEQGSLWSSRMLAPRAAGVHSVRLPVPDRARGLASVVVSQVSRGRVHTATSTVEVTTSRPVTVSVTTDQRSYAQAEQAKVTVEAHTLDGAPSDGVVSLWLADAGYWDLGEDDYPMPGRFHRLPGRMATAGDNTTPLGYGAEEGRVLPDAGMWWNGGLVPGTTYRHGWGHPGNLVTVQTRGRLDAVAQALAVAAGLEGADVCEERAEELGDVALRVRDLPWTLAATKLAELTHLEPWREGRTLRLSCGSSGSGSGYGAGRGAAVPRVRAGAAGVRLMREQRLEGTLYFVPLARLGPDGRIELTVPLPDHPGRWRVEVLAITDDGGGERAHAIVHTTRAVQAWIDLPRAMRAGDEVRGTVQVVAPGHARSRAALAMTLPHGMRFAGPAPSAVPLDDEGRGEVPISLVADEPADALPVEARVTAGADGDGVRQRIDVLARAGAQPLAIRALVGPAAQEVHVPLPELASATAVTLSFDHDVAEGIANELEALREPRWNIPSMRADRLASLAALDRAARSLPEGADRDLLRTRIDNARQAEANALRGLLAADGTVAWWGGLPGDPSLTAEALVSIEGLADTSAWVVVRDALRDEVDRDELSPWASAVAARAMARSPVEEDRAAARRLLSRALSGVDLPSDGLVHAAYAARALEDEAHEDLALGRLSTWLSYRIRRVGSWSCGGPIWFLCFGRWGERGQVARAAHALVDLDGRSYRPLAVSAMRWVVREPPADRGFVWGTGTADELALVAALARVGAPARFEVRIDGRRVPVRGGRVELPAGARNLVVSFPEEARRFSRLRLDGTLAVAEPTSARGDLRISRGFVQRDGLWTLVVHGRLPDDARGARLHVPLPAGLALAPDVRAPAGTRMALRGDGLHLEWSQRAHGGRIELSLPLVPTGSGRFAAGAALLSTRDGTHFGMTPASRVELP